LQILKFSFLNLVVSIIRYKFAITKLKNANSEFWVLTAIFGGFPTRRYGPDNFWFSFMRFSRT
jgi:hypothetical protein